MLTGWNRKDCKPENTVDRIEAILKENGISVFVECFESKEQFFSTRLEIEGIPGVGTNGKGVSRDYSLASAYGELMERLQSGALTSPLFSAKEKKEIYFSDEIKLEPNYSEEYPYKIFSDLANKKAEKIDKLFNLLNKNSKFKVCAPFFNLRTDKTEYLPIRLLELICGSNGLCAGNSMEEALVQGICEILERYVHKQIYQNRVILPSISIDKIIKCNSYKLIETIVSKGFKVIVKDCTLGGKYPVVGALIIDSKNSRYLFTVGSDPDFDIALQRCFTEMFQGAVFDDQFSKQRMLPINYFDKVSINEQWNLSDEEFYKRYREWIKTLVSNSGHHPLSIFAECNCEISFLKAFIEKPFTNKEALKYLVNILLEGGKDVFIRDLSCLGFPTYRIYIDGLTECRYLLDEEIDFLQNERKIQKMHLDICNGHTENIEDFLEIIRLAKKSPVFDLYGVIKNLYKIPVNSNIRGLNDNLFTALLCLINGDYSNSFIKLREYIRASSNNLGSSELGYYVAMLMYLNNRGKGAAIKDVFDVIENIFGKQIKDKLFSELESINIEFPSCPDCSICNINEQCCYQQWKKIDDILAKKSLKTIISQEDLKCILIDW